MAILAFNSIVSCTRLVGRASVFLSLIAALIGAASCRSHDGAADSVAQAGAHDSATNSVRARFGRPPSPARGEASEVLALSPEEQVAVYQPLLPVTIGGNGDPDSEERPWLEARLLPSEGHYQHYEPMPLAVRQALLQTGRFRGACGGQGTAVCDKQSGTTYIFSPIYRITDGAVRVFMASGGYGFGTEMMYHLERRDGAWVIVDKLTTMIT
jgi:hypothetical protein